MSLEFSIEKNNCTQCKLCATVCPARIIESKGDYPSIKIENEGACYKCQHCLSICPTGALSIFGLDPSKSSTLVTSLEKPEEFERLIKGRRSIRRYQDQNLNSETLNKLLELTAYAPTAKNRREVRLTLIDDKARLAALREEFMKALEKKIEQNLVPSGSEIFIKIFNVWKDKKVDIVFRDAPHMLLASVPKAPGSSSLVDCVIALSYFEMSAISLGVGTLWDGMFVWALRSVIPEFKSALGIPEDHELGYAMLFGAPAIHYARAVQRSPFALHVLK